MRMRRVAAPAPMLTGVRGDDQKGRPRTALGACGAGPWWASSCEGSTGSLSRISPTQLIPS